MSEEPDVEFKEELSIDGLLARLSKLISTQQAILDKRREEKRDGS